MAKILVIDDAPELCEVVGDMLEDAGHEVTLVGTSEDGEAACDTHVFNLILCDLVLPVALDSNEIATSDSAMVGVHTIHKLSQRVGAPPIIAVSGFAAADSMDGMRQFGAAATLTKPFTQVELLETVNRLLQNQEQ